MHELSIADAILAVVRAHALGRRVMQVEVEVGSLRQVVPSALSFAFGLLAADTEAEGAELVLRQIPVQVRCRHCGAQSEQQRFPLSCRVCAAAEVQIVRGEELCVTSLEVSDEQRVLEEVR
jgi:hydrogenase nickel incorporation protein HypA/HybF